MIASRIIVARARGMSRTVYLFVLERVTTARERKCALGEHTRRENKVETRTGFRRTVLFVRDISRKRYVDEIETPAK